jgi:hypothetical protein
MTSWQRSTRCCCLRSGVPPDAAAREKPFANSADSRCQR